MYQPEFIYNISLILTKLRNHSEQSEFKQSPTAVNQKD